MLELFDNLASNSEYKLLFTYKSIVLLQQNDTGYYLIMPSAKKSKKL